MLGVGRCSASLKGCVSWFDSGLVKFSLSDSGRRCISFDRGWVFWFLVGEFW